MLINNTPMPFHSDETKLILSSVIRNVREETHEPTQTKLIHISYAFISQITDKPHRDRVLELYGVLFSETLDYLLYKADREDAQLPGTEKQERVKVLIDQLEKLLSGTSKYNSVLRFKVRTLEEQSLSNPPSMVLFNFLLKNPIDKQKAVEIETEDELLVFNQDQGKYLPYKVNS